MYWKSSGPSHTTNCINLALEKAATCGINDIVVASTTGKTAILLAGRASNVICVTHACGFAGPGQNELSDSMRSQLTSQGIKILTTTHVLSGAERGLSKKFGGAYPVEIIAHTLRMFGQGVKVCVEVAIMALDAGLVPHGKEIIAIGGTGTGADTAVVLKPGHASSIFDTYISEIICKP
jgi:hypothetical protein